MAHPVYTSATGYLYIFVLVIYSMPCDDGLRVISSLTVTILSLSLVAVQRFGSVGSLSLDAQETAMIEDLLCCAEASTVCKIPCTVCLYVVCAQ